MTRLHQILVKPVETEKSNAGQKAGKYAFRVRQDATKGEIKRAVEKYYGVKVKSVRTMTNQPKTRSVGRGRVITKRSSFKKAVVTTVGAKPIEVSRVKV
ncbi:MAG: 50S ribosomal protein L23 [Patescibacteria group bacterium]